MQSPLEAPEADSRALSLANTWDDDLSFRRARQVDVYLSSQCGYAHLPAPYSQESSTDVICASSFVPQPESTR